MTQTNTTQGGKSKLKPKNIVVYKRYAERLLAGKLGAIFHLLRDLRGKHFYVQEGPDQVVAPVAVEAIEDTVLKVRPGFMLA